MSFTRFVIGVGLMAFPVCLVGMIKGTEYEKGKTELTNRQFFTITAAAVIMTMLIEIMMSGFWLLVWGGQQ